MTAREDTIERIEMVLGLTHKNSLTVTIPRLTAERAVALLKEQEAKSVLSNRVCEVEPFRYVRKGFCPKCHQEMEWLFNRKYCGFCGQAVKWE